MRGLTDDERFVCLGGTIMGSHGVDLVNGLIDRGVLRFDHIDAHNVAQCGCGPQYRLTMLCDSYARGLVSA